MIYRLIAFFVAVPFIELALLIEIGRQIGTPATLALIVLTGIAGAYLVRIQGFQAYLRLQESLRRGIFPAEEILDGLLILIAGVFLITPGVFTDALGFCLLLEPFRRRVREWLKDYLRTRIQPGPPLNYG